MLEKMDLFFEARISDYDEHMLRDIEGAREFYPFTTSLLPRQEGARVLDLGCGTGLELEYYFRLAPRALVTGIDLSEGMLAAMKEKFPDRNLELIQGSYFDLPLGENRYDAAVSVESLHHFTKEEKLGLYKKLYAALKDGGCFILTDYFADLPEQESFFRRELLRLKAEQGLSNRDFYHYDTPLTFEHEMEALREAGFREVTDLKRWEATHCIRAVK